MKLLPISTHHNSIKNGKLKLNVLIDDEDFEKVNRYKWHITSNGYAKRSSDCMTIHRFIMGCSKGDGKMIDHKDRNKLNCQKHNLRFSTRSQNNANRNPSGNSKYLGVYKYTCKGKWVYFRVFIGKDKRNIYVGNFKNEIDAAKAYDRKAIELHGKFANLNFKINK